MIVPKEIEKLVSSLSSNEQETLIYEMMKQGIIDTEIEGFEKVEGSLTGMIRNAGDKEDHWKAVSLDKDKLEELGKTEAEALNLVSYYEGVFDGLVEARDEGYKI